MPWNELEKKTWQLLREIYVSGFIISMSFIASLSSIDVVNNDFWCLETVKLCERIVFTAKSKQATIDSTYYELTSAAMHQCSFQTPKAMT